MVARGCDDCAVNVSDEVGFLVACFLVLGSGGGGVSVAVSALWHGKAPKTSWAAEVATG